MRSLGTTIAAGLVVFSLSIPLPAHAEMSGKEFIDLYQRSLDSDRPRLRDILSSTVLGFVWANSDLIVNRKTTALYCPPNKLELTGSQVLHIFTRYIEEEPDADKQPFGFVLLKAMQEQFPCPAQ